MANRVLQHIGAKERNNHSLKIKVRLKKLIKFRPHFFFQIITILVTKPGSQNVFRRFTSKVKLMPLLFFGENIAITF